MDAARKHIHGAGPFELVAALLHDHKIAGKAGGLAGNVDDGINTIGQDLGKCLGMDPVSGRIENDQIRLVLNGIDNLKHIACDEFTVM